MTIYSLDILLFLFETSLLSMPFLTVASWPAFRFLKRQVRWSGIPISFRTFQFIVIHTVKGFGIVNIFSRCQITSHVLLLMITNYAHINIFRYSYKNLNFSIYVYMHIETLDNIWNEYLSIWQYFILLSMRCQIFLSLR